MHLLKCRETSRGAWACTDVECKQRHRKQRSSTSRALMSPVYLLRRLSDVRKHARSSSIDSTNTYVPLEKRGRVDATKLDTSGEDRLYRMSPECIQLPESTAHETPVELGTTDPRFATAELIGDLGLFPSPDDRSQNLYYSDPGKSLGQSSSSGSGNTTLFDHSPDEYLHRYTSTDLGSRPTTSDGYSGVDHPSDDNDFSGHTMFSMISDSNLTVSPEDLHFATPGKARALSAQSPWYEPASFSNSRYHSLENTARVTQSMGYTAAHVDPRQGLVAESGSACSYGHETSSWPVPGNRSAGFFDREHNHNVSCFCLVPQWRN